MSENIRERIEKLLRVANDKSADENTAANAMALASALMAKYGVEVSLSTDDEGNETIKGSWIGGGWKKRWHIEIATTVGCLYFVKPVVNRRDGTIMYVGRPDVIAAAEMTHVWLIEQVEKLYKECLPKGVFSKEERSEYRRTFKTACAIRLKNRAWQILCALRDDDRLAIEATGSKSLVVMKARDEALAEAEAAVKGETKSLALKQPKLGIGTRFGMAAGDLVKLQHGVDAKATADADRLMIEDHS